MRVVVSVKATPGGGQTSQAARYVAYRERDEEREGNRPRPLFSAKENALSFWKAERVLTEGRAPQKDELIHIAVSFRDGDFQALGGNETARGQSLREVTREAVSHIADELRADELRWVAGIHRNTDHPHIHLLLHRAYLERETHAERRLARIPAQMLPARVRDENGVEKINPGSFSQAFETALDRAQERAREEAGKERAATSDEKLLEAARTNPSLAGRELIEEIILRGPAREPEERPEATDLRAAFRTPSLDDPDYRTQPEQADWLSRQSQELRDLYERGAQVKGDVLIIPAEEHELSAAGDQPFITGIAYAHQQIRNPARAAEFHALARTIAGENADPRTEIEIFRHYYAQIRAEKLERTLDEMRLLAAEMARLETRESIEIARPVISFEDAQEAEREDKHDAAENDIERDNDRGYSDDFARAEMARGDIDASPVEDRDAAGPIGSFNTAARKVRLDDEALRLPAGLSLDMKLQLVTRTLPALDRQMENGRARAEILTSIGEAVYRGDMDEREREERFHIGGFLKAYVAERLKDPETRALNTSTAFRLANQHLTEARTPEEINRAAESFLRENLDRGNALRLHQSDPARYPKPETMPLNPQERNLLFFGRAAEHHTAEMRELRHAWGLSRAERAERVKALRERRLSPSPVLEQMLTELDSRRSVPALRHYQAAILNEEMRNPGKLNLRQMVDRLPPHERTFLIERIEEKKERITRSQTPARDSKDDLSSGRPFGSIPRASNSYREYLASMGAAELRLLNEAVRQRQNGNGKEDHPFSIAEARALLPREEQTRIREQARHLAWEQITPSEAFAAQPEPTARAVSDTISHLQEEIQQRTRLAHTALDEFVREKGDVNGRNEPHSADTLSRLAPADSQRLRALEDYAARMREELYRGFESLDALRRELERPRSLDAAERSQSIEPNSHSAPDRDPIFSLNGHSAAKDLRLSNGGHFDPDRNSTVDGPPDDRDREPWLVDSTRKWHFDSLRDLAEPMPIADHSIEHDHDFSLDR